MVGFGPTAVEQRMTPARAPGAELRVDLHLHTTASDGVLDPAELMRWSPRPGSGCAR